MTANNRKAKNTVLNSEKDPVELQALWSKTDEWGEVKKATIGGQIREFRKDLGWSQRQLAIYLDIDQSNVGRWERGHHMPSGEHAAKLVLLAERVERPLDLFSAKPMMRAAGI